MRSTVCELEVSRNAGQVLNAPAAHVDDRIAAAQRGSSRLMTTGPESTRRALAAQRQTIEGMRAFAHVHGCPAPDGHVSIGVRGGQGDTLTSAIVSTAGHA